MSDSRANIFKRLRTAQPEIPMGIQEHFTPDINLSREEKIAQFIEKMTLVRAEVHSVSEAEWPNKLINICQTKQLNNLLYAPNGPLGETIRSAWQEDDLPQLLEREKAIDTWKEELFFHVDAAITSTKAGIAETGTLIIWPNAEEPRSYSLVPPIHFALLYADKLYNSFEEVLEKERWQEGLPSNALLISGPSKTADIEQTLAYGVHGPTELVVLLICD